MNEYCDRVACTGEEKTHSVAPSFNLRKMLYASQTPGSTHASMELCSTHRSYSTLSTCEKSARAEYMVCMWPLRGFSMRASMAAGMTHLKSHHTGLNGLERLGQCSRTSSRSVRCSPSRTVETQAEISGQKSFGTDELMVTPISE